ncbi:unnamed protein product [Bursaphelenchus xylophilus]|uniref:(pine wood nematode) hypothetical protein n=1 Tax=Bursaphelenchus xylophilus TaxID=6326 RepID=A0A1I7SH03_BURXY|nr:unnamed protein product [Bursaphelenchus xylophilus]CAG9104792.1 unnamed protein product [Bursaphelenchus xylophilus]
MKRWKEKNESCRENNEHPVAARQTEESGGRNRLGSAHYLPDRPLSAAVTQYRSVGKIMWALDSPIIALQRQAAAGDLVPTTRNFAAKNPLYFPDRLIWQGNGLANGQPSKRVDNWNLSCVLAVLCIVVFGEYRGHKRYIVVGVLGALVQDSVLGYPMSDRVDGGPRTCY